METGYNYEFAAGAGVTQLAESQPSKLLVAGSIPVARSRLRSEAYVKPHASELRLGMPDFGGKRKRKLMLPM